MFNEIHTEQKKLIFVTPPGEHITSMWSRFLSKIAISSSYIGDDVRIALSGIIMFNIQNKDTLVHVNMISLLETNGVVDYNEVYAFGAIAILVPFSLSHKKDFEKIKVKLSGAINAYDLPIIILLLKDNEDKKIINEVAETELFSYVEKENFQLQTIVIGEKQSYDSFISRIINSFSTVERYYNFSQSITTDTKPILIQEEQVFSLCNKFCVLL